MDFLKRGNIQMCDFRNLTEGKARDWDGSLMQSQGFTVTISSYVTFGQNHTAICETCQETRYAFLACVKETLESDTMKHQKAENISSHIPMAM